MRVTREKYKQTCKNDKNHNFLIDDVLKGKNLLFECLKCKFPFKDCYIDPKEVRTTWLGHSQNGYKYI